MMGNTELSKYQNTQQVDSILDKASTSMQQSDISPIQTAIDDIKDGMQTIGTELEGAARRVRIHTDGDYFYTDETYSETMSYVDIATLIENPNIDIECVYSYVNYLYPTFDQRTSSTGRSAIEFSNVFKIDGKAYGMRVIINDNNVVKYEEEELAFESEVTELKEDLNWYQQKLDDDGIYPKQPKISFFGNYTVGPTGYPVSNVNYNAWLIDLNGLNKIKISNSQVNGHFAENPAIIGVKTVDDIRHLGENGEITFDSEVKYVLCASTIESGLQVLATSIKESIRSDVDSNINKLNNIEPKVSEFDTELFDRTPTPLGTSVGTGYYANGTFTNTANLTLRKAVVENIQKIEISGVFSLYYDYYDFLDADNNVLSYKRKMQSTTGDESFVVDVPENAKYVILSAQTVNLVNALNIGVPNKISNIDTLKTGFDSVKNALYTDKLIPLELQMLKGYYAAGVFYSSASNVGRIADVRGLSKVSITARITRLYDFYDFLDENNAVIGFNRNMGDEELKTYVVDVPQGAVKLVVTTQTELKAENTSISKIEKALVTDAIDEKVDALTDRVDSLEGITGNVILNLNGDNVQIRSHFSKENDIAIRGVLHGSGNGTWNYNNMVELPKDTPYNVTIGGTLFKDMSDDITPLYFNGSYRGANHGDDRGFTLTSNSGHGLTEANIGEEWTGANGKKLLICKIISNTQLLCCIPVENPVSNASPFNVDYPSSPITNGISSINFDSWTRGQFKPIANKVNIKVAIDGKEVTADGIYKGQYVDIVESYNLLYLPAMITYLKSNVGNNTNGSINSDEITDSYCTINNIYRFTERGVITLIQSIDWNKNVRLGFVGMVQSITIGNYYSVPLTSLGELQTMGTDTVEFTPTIWDNSDVPPNRYYQYSNSSMTKGICLGYNTELGNGKATNRDANINAGMIYGTSKKLYPYLVNINSDTNDMIQCVSYRIPLGNYDTDIPSVGWYYIGEDIYLLINVQKSVDKYLPLPIKMIGKKITIIETDGNIELPYEMIGVQGIKVKTTNYGSAILKLT